MGASKQNLLRINVQTYSGEGHWWSSVVLCSSISRVQNSRQGAFAHLKGFPVI